MGSVLIVETSSFRVDAYEVNSARTLSSEFLLSRWLSPVLDGRCKWGGYTVSVGRYGSVGHRLVLYPPGISAPQRRWVRLWRGWMVSGLVGVLGLLITFGAVGASRLVIITACVTFYVFGTVVVARRAGPVRRQVLELTAARSHLAPDAGHALECGYLATLAATMTSADAALASGVSSPPEHEMVWWGVFTNAQEHLAAARNDR
ncbi:hypothetical protein C3B61_18655 [Cryobacterium zongtaii]|uniref:Uncharacterized protein n=1 Tax=Cryobacterium zongtaii TaxID=1259217 RepID=A0A2S3Z713_9MICO|nr:hypothetical protein C3B61_18655 [Cryobacterium zongtaii]